MTTTLERIEIKKPEMTWRKEFPLYRRTVESQPEDISPNDATSTKEELFPVWTEELTTDLEKLNKARVGYMSVINSAHSIALKKARKNRIGNADLQKYPPEMVEIILEISKDKNNEGYEKLYNGGSCFLRAGEGEALRHWEKQKLTEIKEALLAAKPAHQNILGYTQQSIIALLSNPKVKITPELESFIFQTAKEIVRLLLFGEQSEFPKFINREFNRRLEASGIKISFKKGEIQQTLFQLLTEGPKTLEEIKENTRFSTPQIYKAADYLKNKGKIQRLSEEEMRKVRRTLMLERLADEDYQKKRKEKLELKRQEKIKANGSYHNFESRIKMSVSTGNKLVKIYPWALLDLSTYIIAQIIEEPNSAIVRSRIPDMRRRGYIKKLSGEERKEKRKQTNNQIKLDAEAKKSFMENFDSAVSFYLPSAKRIVFDLLPKLYPQVDLTLEEKEEITYQTAPEAIKDYDPNGKMGFNAHITKRAVQRLTGCEEFLYLVK